MSSCASSEQSYQYFVLFPFESLPPILQQLFTPKITQNIPNRRITTPFFSFELLLFDGALCMDEKFVYLFRRLCLLKDAPFNGVNMKHLNCYISIDVKK